ncbi:transcriptional repressor [Pseudoalteromonas shioyasakiensis]|uniref:Fur family transcriptional regulator n=1 Tax=Pseudoalteromonas shioyasakiensis TaxID=1190813 RepID=UPI0021193FC2|nr:transcriptional repressor [Pseudoalteromonas shioyasakiensis]
MNQHQLKKAIRYADVRCSNLGGKLTEKRQQVLEILLKAKKPLSAYELTDQFNKVMDVPILAMSVYRILDFLESVDLVHRLKSENKFMACSHKSEGCQHQLSMFLICGSCNKVIEMNDANDKIKALFEQVEILGFSPGESQLEISGVCCQCKAKLPKVNKRKLE